MNYYRQYEKVLLYILTLNTIITVNNLAAVLPYLCVVRRPAPESSVTRRVPAVVVSLVTPHVSMWSVNVPSLAISAGDGFAHIATVL